VSTSVAAVQGDDLVVNHVCVTGLRKNWDVPETFPNTAVIKAYKDAKVDQNKDKFTYGRPDLQLLRRFCLDKFGWQQDRADELLVPVLKVPCPALPCRALPALPCPVLRPKPCHCLLHIEQLLMLTAVVTEQQAPCVPSDITENWIVQNLGQAYFCMIRR